MYSDKMDKECIALCDAINKLPDIETTCSCCGHGKDIFRIWFQVDSLEYLPVLLYYCDPCHVGFRWNCLVTTDCAMSPVSFRIESESKGDVSYQEAQVIADKIMQHLSEPNEEDEE